MLLFHFLVPLLNNGVTIYTTIPVLKNTYTMLHNPKAVFVVYFASNVCSFVINTHTHVGVCVRFHAATVEDKEWCNNVDQTNMCSVLKDTFKTSVGQRRHKCNNKHTHSG